MDEDFLGKDFPFSTSSAIIGENLIAEKEVFPLANEMLYPGQVIALSKVCAQRLIARGHGDGALLYLQMLCLGCDSVTPQVSSALKWDSVRLEEARKVLVAEGLLKDGGVATPVVAISLETPSLDNVPEYSAADLSAEMTEPTSQFRGLVGVVQQSLGKVLSTADLKYLYTMYDHLALPAEVIFLVVNWSIEEHQRKYGAGRMPKLSTISRSAFTWKRRGVDTVEEAESYLKGLSAYRTNEGRLLAVVGVQGRNATSQERRYLEKWIEWDFGDEVITLAYETTLFRTQKMSWNYMSGILEKWHQKGYRTVADIHEGEGKGRTKNGQATATVQGQKVSDAGDANRRVQEDMERMRAFMKAQKEQEGGEGHGL